MNETMISYSTINQDEYHAPPLLNTHTHTQITQGGKIHTAVEVVLEESCDKRSQFQLRGKLLKSYQTETQLC